MFIPFFSLVMSNGWTHYSSELKARAVEYCASADPTHSYRAAAREFNVRGGGQVVKQWCEEAAQDEKEETRGRKRKLTMQQVQEHIREWTREQNRKPKHVDFDLITVHIKEAVGVDLSRSTVKRYAHDECKLTWKEHTLVAPSDG
jgi:transposase